MRAFSATPSRVASLFVGGSIAESPFDPDATAIPMKPVVKGRIGLARPVASHLETGIDGMHAYLLTGRRDEMLHLRLACSHFRGLLHVIGPSGQRWNRPACGDEALPPIALPEDGVYQVFVTSLDNLIARAPVSHGDYVLMAEASAPAA